MLKPDIVYFGESVPKDRVEQAYSLVDEADALLVAGSSLTVFSGYPVRPARRRAGHPDRDHQPRPHPRRRPGDGQDRQRMLTDAGAAGRRTARASPTRLRVNRCPTTPTTTSRGCSSLLERRRPDPGPVVGRWALGIGDMVADHSLTPRKLRGLVRKLNHFGGVAISEEAVEFDGDDGRVGGRRPRSAPAA